MDFAALSFGYVLRHLHSVFRAFQDNARFSQENATGFSKPHGLYLAVKKCDAKLFLQIPHLPA